MNETVYAVIGLAVATIAVAALFWFMVVKVGGETKIRGPALMGSAQVLSVKQRGTIGTWPNQKFVKRIGLRVQVPGREPYEVTVRQNFRLGEFTDAKLGTTVPVQADSTNPQKVRIDLGWPSTPQVGSFSTNIPAQGDPANPINIRINLSQPPTLGVQSLAELLASGQRVSGALKSFAPTGTTSRSEGLTPSRSELFDAPRYKLVVELHFPNLAPMDVGIIQPVPPARVPNLAIGLPLTCAVDPANPQRCAVDWDAITH